MFAAILDTCVLWPSLQRDLLLSMARDGLYRPFWSDGILAELKRNEVEKLIERGDSSARASERADWLMSQLLDHFPKAQVQGSASHGGTFGLPDIDDEHVLAAAVAVDADAIVTDNIRHFPRPQVPDRIDVIRAREFAAQIADKYPDEVANAIADMARRYVNPPRKASELVDLLAEKNGMTRLAETVAPLL